METDRARYPAMPSFATPEVITPASLALQTARDALERVLPGDALRRTQIHTELLRCFPDEAPPDGFWHQASSRAFRDFFVWGHDYDWGGGACRTGAMGPRHVEIAAEALQYGLLPASLAGSRVLDVGCWSGGDLLLLRGLGANVEAIEEHRKSAASAAGLCSLLDVSCPIVVASLYEDRPAWRERFDVVYCSGVIYHVTDPLLFLRICFAYLKVGGRLVIETKAAADVSGSMCTYSGTLEKGWNWYAPNREALGRWLVDAGFDPAGVRVLRRANGRLLAGALKTEKAALAETAGFSRPGSWLEGVV